MKTSGSFNRQQKQKATERRLLEMSTTPRRLSFLPEEQREEAQQIMDLIYWGMLTNPDEASPEEILIEEPEKPSSKQRASRGSS